jgi:asparagine synthase (glutamine-hydrolysing)
MCRISGIIHLTTPPQYEKIHAMCDSMKHGGPDDSGIYLACSFRSSKIVVT